MIETNNPRNLEAVYALLEQRFGWAISRRHLSTENKITNVLAELDIATWGGLLRHLAQPAPSLVKSLVVGETFFFRNHAHFEALRTEVLPRLVQGEWPSQKSVRLHFNCSAIGVLLIVLSLGVGGLIQGVRMQDPSVPFVAISKGTVPFVGMSTLGLILLLIGQFAFLANFLGLMRRFCEPFCRAMCATYCCSGPSPTAKSGTAEVKS